MPRQETSKAQPNKVEELKKQLEVALQEEAQQAAQQVAQQELSKAQTFFTEAIAKAAVEAGELRRKVQDLTEELEKARGEAKSAEQRAEAAMSKLAALQKQRGQSKDTAALEEALLLRATAAENRINSLVQEVKELKAAKESAKESAKAAVEPLSSAPAVAPKTGPSWADMLKEEEAPKNEAAKAPKKEAPKAKTPAAVEPKVQKAAPKPEDLAAAEASKPNEARIAARHRQIEEERKKEEQKIAELKRLRKQREEEERREQEEEEAAREQQRREDEEREARQMLDKAIQKQEEEEKARRKMAKQEERKKREEEEQKEIALQKEELSVEDFEALLLMKAEVEPEEECSPDELDEEEILDLEIKRVQREEMKMELQKKMAERSRPPTADIMGAVFPEDLQKKISKSRQENHRALLKQKLQAKREMAGLVQGRRH